MKILISGKSFYAINLKFFVVNWAYTFFLLNLTQKVLWGRAKFDQKIYVLRSVKSIVSILVVEMERTEEPNFDWFRQRKVYCVQLMKKAKIAFLVCWFKLEISNFFHCLGTRTIIIDLQLCRDDVLCKLVENAIVYCYGRFQI